MGTRCKVCNSKHRGWIEAAFEEGTSLRVISAELEQQHGESISYVALGEHFKRHMNQDETTEIVTALEARIRNLEIWMAKAIPAETALTWFEQDARGEQKFSITNYTLYKSTIPNFDALGGEEAAIKSRIVEKHKADAAKRKEQQRREAVRQNEAIAAEKREREEAAEKARAELEKVRIEKLRQEVNTYDNGEATIS